ncbi:MAG: hypothetical protein PWR02_1500 [Synergistales bacterium]|nr:hypothetical protein [Synergistales bacterium]
MSRSPFRRDFILRKDGTNLAPCDRTAIMSPFKGTGKMSPPWVTILNMKNRGELPYILCKRGLARSREAPPGKEARQLHVCDEPAPKGFPKLRIGEGYAYTCGVFMPLHTVRRFC